MKFTGKVTAAGIAVAVALSAATRTNAVELNSDGTGQVLIYPYYTVNANNSTVFSVVNTKSRAKAVKLQILEAYNGQGVMDFNLFLSGYDVWTANIFALSPTGAGNLLTDDESCTIPDIKGGAGSGTAQLPAPDGRSYIWFRTGQLQVDGGPKTADRTREGHFQIVELATIAAGSTLEQAVTHVDGVPTGCTNLQRIISSNPLALLKPTGGLYGSAAIVNPELGTLIGYSAEAIDAFYMLDNSLYIGDSEYYLGDARTTDVDAVAASYAPRSTDGPAELVRSTYIGNRAIDAVSAIFMSSAIANEYIIEANSASESEWVINFPTKHFYVNSGATGIAPFVERFFAPGRSCVKVDPVYFDREERLLARSPDFPNPLPPTSLCYQTQVLTFQRQADYAASGGVSAVLGSRLTNNLDPRALGFSAGWLRLDLNPSGLNGGPNEPHALRPSVDLDVYHGLPVTGFLATNYLNRNNGAPNVLSTYSVGARHRAERKCSNSTPRGNGFCE